MAHFNFVISQNAKWGHSSFYIDCHRMTVPENILLQKSTACIHVTYLLPYVFGFSVHLCYVYIAQQRHSLTSLPLSSSIILHIYDLYFVAK